MRAAGQYSASFRPVEALHDSERAAMMSLYFAHYDGSSEAQFLSDLQDKTEVLIVRCDDRLIGFTTVELYQRQWQTDTVRILYSGDTVVDRAHWGQQALAFAWVKRLGQLMHETPEISFYWFAIFKGHRTFKFLPTFARSFYPHWAIDRSDLKPLLDFLAREKFGEAYNVDSGVIEFADSKGHLKPDIAVPTPEERNKEAVSFFLERNPRYTRGHELACICEIKEENMRPLTHRLFVKGRL